MRRATWIFFAAILLPGLVLAWLAERSARDQQIVLEHQQALLSQDIADALGKKVRDRLEEARPAFIGAVQQLLRKSSGPRALAEDFDRDLRGVWEPADVGFAVNLNGTIYSPSKGKEAAARTFLNENDRFLGNRESVPVFSQNGLQPALAQQQQSQSPMSQSPRQVTPLNIFTPLKSALSNSLPVDSDFRRVIGKETSGTLARFLEDNLRLMVWYRPPGAGPVVFGEQLGRKNLIRSLEPLLQSSELHRDNEPAYCLAILDDRGKPVALSRAGFRADWKHPFVATEIGDALPHWEAALYPVDPQQIGRSAAALRLSLAAIVMTLVGAILLGGWLLSADVRRAMRLAQQKTDFVSNVSHELKTPLTSIRLFADMLADGRVTEPERRNNYLGIISSESARLTRLIENVLQFARIERGMASGERRPCDLVDIVSEVGSLSGPPMESAGVTLEIALEADSLPLDADRDAVAQILLNLLSNAEKYGGPEVLVRVRREDGGSTGVVEVLDRGLGIPPGKNKAIFEPFCRLDDSLTSGVSGSGLGLTLARRMAREHGGDVTYAPRVGGGSCFRFALPLRERVGASEEDTRG